MFGTCRTEFRVMDSAGIPGALLLGCCFTKQTEGLPIQLWPLPPGPSGLFQQGGTAETCSFRTSLQITRTYESFCLLDVSVLHINIYIYMDLSLSLSLCLSLCTYTHMYMYTYIYLYPYTCIYTYLCVFIVAHHDLTMIPACRRPFWRVPARTSVAS